MLRPAKHTDIKHIHRLITWAASQGRVLPRPLSEIAEVIDSFFVWEEGGTAVACCSLEVYSKKLAEIRSLVVLEEYQNKGIGKKLTGACVEKSRKLGIYEVLTITDKDIFFEKMGFKKSLNGQWAMFMRP